MKYDDIRLMPTVRDNVHESVYRAFHILNKVKDLLSQNTAPGIVLELIEHMEVRPEAVDAYASKEQDVEAAR